MNDRTFGKHPKMETDQRSVRHVKAHVSKQTEKFVTRRARFNKASNEQFDERAEMG